MTGVQTCALPISTEPASTFRPTRAPPPRRLLPHQSVRPKSSSNPSPRLAVPRLVPAGLPRSSRCRIGEIDFHVPALYSSQLSLAVASAQLVHDPPLPNRSRRRHTICPPLLNHRSHPIRLRALALILVSTPSRVSSSSSGSAFQLLPPFARTMEFELTVK